MRQHVCFHLLSFLCDWEVGVKEGGVRCLARLIRDKIENESGWKMSRRYICTKFLCSRHSNPLKMGILDDRHKRPWFSAGWDFRHRFIHLTEEVILSSSQLILLHWIMKALLRKPIIFRGRRGCSLDMNSLDKSISPFLFPSKAPQVAMVSGRRWGRWSHLGSKGKAECQGK